MRLVETFWKIGTPLNVFPLHHNYIYTDLCSYLFGAVSQSYRRYCLPGAVLILPLIKLNSQLSCCALFFIREGCQLIESGPSSLSRIIPLFKAKGIWTLITSMKYIHSLDWITRDCSLAKLTHQKTVTDIKQKLWFETGRQFREAKRHSPSESSWPTPLLQLLAEWWECGRDYQAL